ncbi:hypothetical protein REPUB_Repub16aG0034100 [Reevesia pubescens]
MVLHKNPTSVFLICHYASGSQCCDKAWKLAFFAIVWSIWLLQNEIVFTGKSFDHVKTIHVIKFRIIKWFKEKWPSFQYSELNVIGLFLDTNYVIKKKITDVVWRAPHASQIKFNVDGSAHGNPRQSSIGGILRNENGCIKMLFSKRCWFCRCFFSRTYVCEKSFSIVYCIKMGKYT